MFSTSIQSGTATHMAMLYIDAHVCSIYSTFYSQQRPSSARCPATDRERVLHLKITSYTWRAYVPVDPPWHLRSTVLKSHKYLLLQAQVRKLAAGVDVNVFDSVVVRNFVWAMVPTWCRPLQRGLRIRSAPSGDLAGLYFENQGT